VSSQSEVMHCYEQIAPITERMLMLARTAQWGELPALEAQNSDTVDRLKAIEPQETLDESQIKRKYQLLGRIQANHDEIFSIVMPQLAALRDSLKSLAFQHSLYQTYGQTNDPLS
jgi:flagellar protein FliT